MKIAIDKIHPNPFRDFTLYPIEDEQVRRLTESINELGFFSGVTARKVDGGYELAAGHHRLAAAKRAKLDHIEAVVEQYDDDEMVAIMAVENLTQRGRNAASVVDSVAAYSRRVTRAVLLGDGEVSRILEASRSALANAQSTIAEQGPGMPLLYRAMNGFDKEERAAKKEKDPHAERISSTEIDTALRALKQGNIKGSSLTYMGKIVSEEYQKVEAIRAEREAAERREEEKRQEAERKAREKAEAELRRRQEAEAKAQRDAEEKQRKAEAAAKADKEKKAKAEAEAKAAREEQARRKAEREAEEKRQAEERKKREAEKQDESERKAKEEERRRKEREAVQRQKELEAVYDIRVPNVFRLSSHEEAFRKFVLSPNGKRFIPRDQQLPLARQIRLEIDQLEQRHHRDLGGVTIEAMLRAHLEKVMGMQREIDDEERNRVLMENAEKRVNALWIAAKTGAAKAESALIKLVEEADEWDYGEALFPIDQQAIDTLIDIGKRVQELKKQLGL